MLCLKGLIEPMLISTLSLRLRTLLSEQPRSLRTKPFGCQLQVGNPCKVTKKHPGDIKGNLALHSVTSAGSKTSGVPPNSLFFLTHLDTVKLHKKAYMRQLSQQIFRHGYSQTPSGGLICNKHKDRFYWWRDNAQNSGRSNESRLYRIAWLTDLIFLALSQ